MKAKDVMSSPAITVLPDTPLNEAVDILLNNRISGVLVVEGARVVGVLGDGDLVHRHEIGTHGPGNRNWWNRLMGAEPGPHTYVKTHGARVRDVMNHEVVTVHEDTPLSEIARIFEKRHIRRVPVLRGAQLVGLVTRADLVRAMAASTSAAHEHPVKTDDDAIRTRLLAELGQQAWWSDSWSSVFVQNGLVIYVGMAHSQADINAARVAAENIPGVLAVEDRRLIEEEWQPMM